MTRGAPVLLAQGSPARRALRVLVTSTVSDAHTWNLVFLQLLLEEQGHHVHNLGCCVPAELLVAEVRAYRPELILVSSINGHGYVDGLALMRRLRTQFGRNVPRAVIGGKLGTDGAFDASRIQDLLSAGFDAVFDEGAPAGSLRAYTDSMAVEMG